MCRACVAVLGLLLAGDLAAEPLAPAWVYPTETFRDENGRAVFPTTDGRRFDSAMEREAYLRHTRELRRQVEQAADEVRRRRRVAVAAPQLRNLPTPPSRVIRREPTELNPSGYRRELREDSLARQQAEQDALQRFLEGGRRTGAAETRADLSAVRLGRQRQLAAGMDRLYSGAEAARQTLGQPEQRPIGPLIRTPRIRE